MLGNADHLSKNIVNFLGNQKVTVIPGKITADDAMVTVEAAYVIPERETYHLTPFDFDTILQQAEKHRGGYARLNCEPVGNRLRCQIAFYQPEK